jgi:hypothetical protein
MTTMMNRGTGRIFMLAYMYICLASCKRETGIAATLPPQGRTGSFVTEASLATSLPPGRMGSAPRPLPTVVFQFEDLTSAVGKGPYVVAVRNSGKAVGETMLRALAQELRLHSLDGKREIPLRTTFVDVVGDGHGPNGYPKIGLARVEVEPTVPLPDDWYVLRIRALPPGFAVPRVAARQTLPDGGIGVRIAPASHPRPAAVRLCEKRDGVSVMVVEWSEEMPYPSTASPGASVRDATSSTLPADCVLDPSVPAAMPTKRFRFLCQNVPKVGGRLVLGLDPSTSSVSGKQLELPVAASGGKAEAELALDSMQPAGEGCKILKPW